MEYLFPVAGFISLSRRGEDGEDIQASRYVRWLPAPQRRLSRWGIHALDPRDRVSPSSGPDPLEISPGSSYRSPIRGNRRAANHGLPAIAASASLLGSFSARALIGTCVSTGDERDADLMGRSSACLLVLLTPCALDNGSGL